MTKEFLPYDRALKLKQLVFDEPCFVLYKASNNNQLAYAPHGIITNSQLSQGDPNNIAAPLFQQAFRWFREKHGMVFNLVGSGPYYPSIAFILIDGNSDIELGEYDNYDEAELACLDKMIEIVESKM
jgi:hypothetical protein